MTAPLSRRRFLGAGAAVLAARAMGSSRPHLSLPVAEQLNGAALLRGLGAGSGAMSERLGLSRAGQPIDLVTIGQGPRAALIVGAPHANEPIGCATILRLLKRLSEDRALREGSGWRWHFIPAIDIDGIALNQGWFGGSRTLTRYLRDFYRPPLRRQPEYAFPLDLAGYQFHEETPESLCWRLALDHIRPQLLCSLHGADTGGSFFLVSQPRSALDTQLTRLPAAAGITLNTFGEPAAGITPLAPGVFSLPDIDSAVSKAVAAGRPPQTVWDAGDSSAGYSGKRFGTFNMVCEVPLWRDARERDGRGSGRTLAQVLNDQAQMMREDESLLSPFLAELRTRASGDTQSALLASVEDAVLQTAAGIEEIEGMAGEADSRRLLALRELVQYEYGTAMFRTLAMAQRLAGLEHLKELEARAGERLAGRLAAFSRLARLEPVELDSSTGLQMAAILSTARDLRDRG